MTTATPQLKTNELTGEINHLLASGQNPDEFTLKRLKSEANKIIRVDEGEGHALLGMIAWLEVNIDLCKKHYELAIRLNNDVVDCCNYAGALRALGLSDEAYQLIKKAPSFPKNPYLLESAIDFALNCGRFQEANSYYYNFLEIISDGSTRALRDRSCIDLFIKAKISDKIAITLMTLADELVRKHNLRKITQEFLVDETEDSFDFAYWIEVNAVPKKVVEMDIELCQRLAKIPNLFKQPTFSISYKSGQY